MLTPEEIFEKEFKRKFRGYDEDEVNDFLDKIIQDYTRLLTENKAIKSENQQLKASTSRQDFHTNTGKPSPEQRMDTLPPRSGTSATRTSSTNPSIGLPNEKNIIQDLLRRVELLERKTKYL